MSNKLGTLTYPVYLIHNVFGATLIAKFATEENKVLVYIATVIILLVTAFIMNNLIENGLSRYWKLFFNSTLGRFVSIIDFSQHKQQRSKVKDIQ
jgi:peptidoglycan/LPS O-acetylase OafA/YrhL